MQEVNYIPISPSKTGGASRVHNKKKQCHKTQQKLTEKKNKI